MTQSTVMPTARGRRDAADQLALLAAHATIVGYLLVWLWEPLARIRGVPWVAQVGLLPAVGIMAVVLAAPERLRRAHLPLLMIGYLAWAVVSISWTSQWDNGLVVIKGELLALALVGLVVSLLPPPAVVRTLLATFVAVGGLSLLLVVVWPGARSQIIGDQSEILQIGWLAGFGSKNFLGMFAVLGLGLVLAFVSDPRTRLVLGAMFVALVIGSRSATAFLALLVTILVWSMPIVLARLRRWGRTPVAVLLAVSGPALVALVPLTIWIYGKDSTLSKRTVIWSESWRLIRDAPLIGHGIGAVWFRQSDPLSMRLNSRIGFRAFHAHNGILDVWLAVGLVGVLLMLAMLVRIGQLAWRAVRVGGEADVYGRWAATVLAAMLTMAVVEPVLRQGALGYLLIVWVVLAGLVRQGPPALAPRREREPAR